MLELAQFAGWLLSPLSFAMLAGLLAWVVRRRRPGLAKALAVVGFAVLWLGSTAAVSDLIAAPLENRYVSVPIASTPAGDAIVVLGGALAAAHPPQRPNMGLGPSADRVWQAAALYRAGKAPWVVVAAGNRDPEEGLEPEAAAITRMLGVLGVPPERIRVDDRSRNTRENAVNAKAILAGLGARRVLLVTSAHHLPRAVKTFEKVWGTGSHTITPVPANVATDDADYFTLWAWIPSAESLRFVTRSLKEYAGIAVLGIM